jgi:hypothetical protein
LGTGALPTTITVASGNIVDGTISNVEISASAAIADTKLDTISTADKVSLSALNIDGGTDIGAALADADLFIVDDGGAGTNRKAAATRITDYTFGKVSGDITITSSGVTAISSGVIVNADVNASAAIAGTKISPDFGSQNTTTTGTSTAASFSPTSSTAPTNGVYLPSSNNVAISTSGTGRLFVDANGNVEIKAQGDLRFADSDSSNWVAFQAPATVASNVTWTLPAADGFNGQALTTNGSSTLAWATVGDVTLTGTQTLTNKTLTDPSITGTILEDVFTITDGAAFEIDPGNGSVQLITLGASRTPKATNFAAGEAVTLMVDDGSAYTLTWTDATWGGSGVVWKTDSGSAPTLNTTGYTAIILWKVSTQVYGARVGDA